MSLDLSELTPVARRTRPARRIFARLALASVMVALIVGGAWAWGSGVVPGRFWESRPQPLPTVAIDRGDVAVYVVETGTMESASNTTVKCQVEALVGMVGGTSKGAGGSGGGQSSSGGSQAGASSAGTSKAQAAATTATKGATSKAATTTSAAGAATAGASAGAATGGASGSGASTTTVTQRPTIRSFTFVSTPYVSLRPATKATTTTKGAGGGGNRGGGMGGGGGGGGMGGEQEKAGSTRIIVIKPEGTQVSAGEVVCELDSSAFKDALVAQRIRHDQAKSWVAQARSILEVNEISLREYRDGILPQDLMLIRQYLSTCRREQDRARRNLEWSEPVYKKGFRTRAQYEADVFGMKRADIALGEAERMESRLIQYTGPKILKSLEAKLEANRADVLAQEAALQIETDRMKRLDRMVSFCTLRAPHEGIVVYAVPPSNGPRPSQTNIQEGATVREGQSIFELPDANMMRVRAKVNESKVGLVQAGQRAMIRVDAFPGRPLAGTVTEVTAIPAPANGPSSDIKVYFANVAIDSGGFEGLRPGLSAEVSLFVDAHRDAARVPLQSVRWVDREAFAAVATAPDGSSYRWQAVQLGLMNDTYAEILGGLSPGDRVLARPEDLPAPSPSASPALRAAGDGGRTRG